MLMVSDTTRSVIVGLTCAPAVLPEQAAEYISKFIDTFDMSKTGTYWAPRGGKDIGNAEVVLGKEVAAKAPLQLPW